MPTFGRFEATAFRALDRSSYSLICLCISSLEEGHAAIDALAK